jgi:stage II sporulation protein AB (anti-sigma F factor)
MRKAKQTENSIVFTLPAISINEGVARATVGAFLAQMDPTVEDLADVKCAVSEAVTNAIVHAYPRTGDAQGERPLVYITAEILPGREVRITVRDKGCGIADVKAARTPLYTTDPDGERSGMGFSVMESFTDRMRVLSRVGRGTRVTLYKIMK